MPAGLTGIAVLLGGITFVLLNALLDRTFGGMAEAGKNVVAFASGLGLAPFAVAAAASAKNPAPVTSSVGSARLASRIATEYAPLAMTMLPTPTSRSSVSVPVWVENP